MGLAQLRWLGLGGARGSFGHRHEVGGLGISLGIGAFGVCLGRVGYSGIDLSALAVYGGKLGGRGIYWAWVLLVCLMWVICSIDWVGLGGDGCAWTE